MVRFSNLKNISITRYHLVTISFLVLVILAASYGKLHKNIFIYYVDFIALIVYFLLAYFVTNAICIFINKSRKVEAFLLSFFYLYSAFACFIDGSVAGWSHTETLVDKIFFILLSLLLLSMTVFIPVIFFLIAFIHNLIIAIIMKKKVSCNS